MLRNLATLFALATILYSTAAVPVAEAQERQCPGGRGRIVGGERARLANWPGQAAIRVRADKSTVRYFCGGTAISDRWILTAAHCMHEFMSDPPAKSQLEVVLGSSNLTRTSPQDVYPVERIVMHERYREAYDKAMKLEKEWEREYALERIVVQVGDDIALIRLTRPWMGPLARPSLSRASDPPAAGGTQVRVAGFGFTEHLQLNEYKHADGKTVVEAGSEVLLETAVQTLAEADCKGVHGSATIGSGQICAGLEKGERDSCSGDSGGPLVVTDSDNCPSQVGIVSWGPRLCGEAKAYAVYTRISQHAEWIQKHTGPLKGAPARPVVAANVLTAAQLEQALRQLESLLGPAKGRVSIGVRGGNRVRLGDEVVFEAASEIAGKLVILDINASREVLPLYPNKYVASGKAGSIAAGQRVTVPGPDYPGFTAFQAIEPAGKGRLLALVVPQDFDIERHISPPAGRARGFAAVNNPPSYLMRVIRQIEQVLGARMRSAGATEIERWGYAVAEYEIWK